MAVELFEIGIAITAIAIVGTFASRFGQSVIPAYIVAGILVGPHDPKSFLGVLPLTLVPESQYIDVLAELGVVFLLFFLGLEFSIQQLLANRNRLVRIGTIDFVVNFGIGILIGAIFGLSVLQTLFVAGIVYISSSAIITKSLIETGWIANPESEPILSTLVFEDILIAVYLALLSALVLGDGEFGVAAFSIVKAFGFLGGLALVAWYGTRYVERLFETPSDELFLLQVTGITALIAGGALAAGVSEAVAAFFIGMTFSQTDHVERIEQVIAPARDLFAAIFFFAIGLTVDVTILTDIVGLLVAAVVVTTLGKIVSGTLAGRQYNLDTTRSLRVGIGLVPRGEFSLVVGALATSAGLASLSAFVPAFAAGYVLFMGILGTMLMHQADGVVRHLERVITQVNTWYT